MALNPQAPTSAVREQFAIRAKSYDRRTAWVRDASIGATALRDVLRTLPQSPLCMDIGSGTGRMIEGCRDDARWVAVDSSNDMLLRSSVSLRVAAEAERLPFRDRSADLITTRSALPYFDAPAFFREAGRVLKRGGYCLAIEKVLGPFEMNGLDWFRAIEAARNPLKKPLVTSNEISDTAVSAKFKLCSQSEHTRYYEQNYDEWLATIPGGAENTLLMKIAAAAPPSVREIGFAADEGGVVTIPITWSILLFQSARPTQ